MEGGGCEKVEEREGSGPQDGFAREVRLVGDVFLAGKANYGALRKLRRRLTTLLRVPTKLMVGRAIGHLLLLTTTMAQRSYA